MKSQAENVYTTVNKILYIAPVLLRDGGRRCLERRTKRMRKKREEEL